MATIRKASITSVDIRAEGERVIVLHNGRLLWDMDWQTADMLSKALYVKAREAEEVAKAEQAITDSAILMRVGAPIGLSNNRDIQREARKEAAWNSRLRRYLPGGVKSREVFGTPSITKEKKP